MEQCISRMTEYDNMVISLANHKKALYDRRLSHGRAEKLTAPFKGLLKIQSDIKILFFLTNNTHYLCTLIIPYFPQNFKHFHQIYRINIINYWQNLKPFSQSFSHKSEICTLHKRKSRGNAKFVNNNVQKNIAIFRRMCYNIFGRGEKAPARL